MFREDKATAIASFFAEKIGQKEINDLDLMKLMYFSERRSLHDNTSLMTGDVFVNMNFGPVLSHAYDCMKGDGDHPLWSQHFAPLVMDTHTIRVRSRSDYRSVLADWEIELLTAVWDEHGAKSKWDKVAHAHSPSTPEWEHPKPFRVRQLELETVFYKGFDDDAEVAASSAALVKNVEGLRKMIS